MWIETTEHGSVSGEGCDSVDSSQGHDGNSWGNGGMCDREAVWVETTEHGSVSGEGCDSVEGSQGDGSMHHAVSRPCTMQEREREKMNKIEK